jgi:hypothetical protein
MHHVKNNTVEVELHIKQIRMMCKVLGRGQIGHDVLRSKATNANRAKGERPCRTSSTSSSIKSEFSARRRSRSMSLSMFSRIADLQARWHISVISATHRTSSTSVQYAVTIRVNFIPNTVCCVALSRGLQGCVGQRNINSKQCMMYDDTLQENLYCCFNMLNLLMQPEPSIDPTKITVTHDVLYFQHAVAT